MVPKGGLEPPHPCEYMDLNHARLPIPPLRQRAHSKQRKRLEYRSREHQVLQTLPSLSIPSSLTYTLDDWMICPCRIRRGGKLSS